VKLVNFLKVYFWIAYSVEVNCNFFVNNVCHMCLPGFYLFVCLQQWSVSGRTKMCVNPTLCFYFY